MDPSAGPIFARHVATALAEVTGSIPVITIISVPQRKIKRYNAIKDIMLMFVFSVTVLPLSRIREMAFG